MEKVTAERADELAEQIKRIGHAKAEPSDIRDLVDTYTEAELDCFELDMLTDMVEQRLKASAA